MKKLLIPLLAILLLSACGRNETSSALTVSERFNQPEPTIEITVDSAFIESWMTQEDIDEEGYPATLNEDGSVTYILTETEHEQLMASISAESESMLEALQKNNPTLLSITHNDTFSSFTVELESSELSFSEALSMVTLFGVGQKYSAYAGKPDEIIYLTYVHNGDVVYSCNSSQL